MPLHFLLCLFKIKLMMTGNQHIGHQALTTNQAQTQALCASAMAWGEG
jgi:hypothetical protein